jgi:antitoxin component of MazEF toxin-antitoxin module
MIKRLTPTGDGLALVIDRAILELLKIGEDARVQVSTDGRRLIIEPVDDAAVKVAIQVQESPAVLPDTGPLAVAPLYRDESRLSEPSATVEIIDELTNRYGMSNEQFRDLHHAQNYLNTIQAHRSYCARQGGGPFRMGGTNFRTAKRLLCALEALRARKSWPVAVERALLEYPK